MLETDVGYFVNASTSSVQDLAIVDTQPEDTGWYGRGLALQGIDASITGARVLVADNTELGLYVAGGRVALSALVGVRFVDNGRNVDGHALPIPDPNVPGEIER